MPWLYTLPVEGNTATDPHMDGRDSNGEGWEDTAAPSPCTTPPSRRHLGGLT